MPLFALTPERSNENINVIKNFISSNGDRTHKQSALQSHFMSLRHAWPQNFIIISIVYKYISTNKLDSAATTLTDFRF